MTLRELREKRSRTVAAMREIAEAPAAGADLSEEQATRFETLKTELRSVEQAIERQELIDDADRRAAGQPVTGSGDGHFDAEVRQFSITRAIAAQVPNLNVDAGREREVSQELARRSGFKGDGFLVPTAVFEERVLTSTAPAGGPGGNLIATDHLGNQFIDRLRSAIRVRALGARVLNGLSGNVDIPRLKGSATTGWVAENQALTKSDHQFDKVVLTPKHAGALTELSRNMLLQSSPDIEALVRADFAAILAAAVDRVAINGGGTNEPDGILQTAGIGSVAAGTNGGALTLDLVADLVGAVEDADAAEGALAYLTNTKVKRAAMKLKDGNAVPYGLEKVFPDYGRAFTNLVPSDLTKGTGTDLSALIFGNWSDLLLGYWDAFSLLVNPYEADAYAKGNVSIRAMLTCDVAVRHPESFAAITDLTTV